MFRKDGTRRRGSGIILYIKASILVYEIELENNLNVWFNIVIETQY